jgi:membrane protease YdiL (CAAX protease family)
VAWLWPLPLIACLVILAPLFGAGKPDFSFARGIHFLVQSGVPASDFQYPWLRIVYWLISAIPGALILFGEEFGWRGYLQLRLFPDRPLASAIGTGIIWAVWHYPITFRGFNYPDHPIIGSLVVFPVTGVFLSIIFGWLVSQTGSIWSSSLAHSATNVIAGGLFLLLFGGGGNWLVVSPAGILGWIPLGAFSAWIVLTGQLKPRSEAGPPVPSDVVNAAHAGL